jgi:uncharacterized membrane protein
MELFLAQNHSAMTHLPIAASIMAALTALIALYANKKEFIQLWAILSLIAFIAVPPTIVTGIAAAKGRFNEKGTPYIQKGLLVDRIPANSRIFRHEIMGIGGTILSGVLAAAAVARLRGREMNRLLIALLAVLLAVLWGIGGHLGGEELWSPDTFPAFK